MLFLPPPLPTELRHLLNLSEAQARALTPLIRQTFRRGGVLGVARGGREQTLSLGGIPEAGVFELASVTKPFTAALVSGLVREGRLAWDTPIAALGGPLRRLPTQLTPYALATHAAGVPAHPLRMTLTTLTNFSDPYGGMSAADVLASARRWARPAQAGTFVYSNLGMGVLALAAAYAAGEELSATGYERALRQHVTLPLGLVGLGLRPAREVVSPYGLLGGTDVTQFAELAGAGGLFGSAPELLRFGEAQARGELGGAWQLVWTGRSLPKGLSGVAPGWFHTGGAIWHDGTARGTRTALGFQPRTGLVVTLLARGAAPIGRRDELVRLLLQLLGESDGFKK